MLGSHGYLLHKLFLGLGEERPEHIFLQLSSAFALIIVFAGQKLRNVHSEISENSIASNLLIRTINRIGLNSLGDSGIF
jgi:hypothetical protein